jgi:hypothetical protein
VRLNHGCRAKTTLNSLWVRQSFQTRFWWRVKMNLLWDSRVTVSDVDKYWSELDPCWCGCDIGILKVPTFQRRSINVILFPNVLKGNFALMTMSVELNAEWQPFLRIFILTLFKMFHHQPVNKPTGAQVFLMNYLCRFRIKIYVMYCAGSNLRPLVQKTS